METSKPAFLKYIFVCENLREKDPCCGASGTRIRGLLKEAVKQRGLSGKIRVSRAGCLDVCGEGPNVLLMPDNIWFKRVQEKDVETILETVIDAGRL